MSNFSFEYFDPTGAGRPLALSLILLITLSLGDSRGDENNLFHGSDLSDWKEPIGTWSVVESVALDASNPKYFSVRAGRGVTLSDPTSKSVNLISKVEHGDARILVEFMVPRASNSGIYIQGRYEIQIFDSYSKPEIGVHDCGAIYERWDVKRGKGNEGYEGHIPKLNASKAPGEWQSFDIHFRAPRFDSTGKKIENAKFVRVIQNGKVIHENVEMTGPTRGSKFETEAETGPILIQGDHGPVAFRKLVISKID